MIHIIKNYKWVIATSLISIIFGLLTFFTFINQSFIALNNLNLQILLIIDLVLLVLFFGLIIFETYKVLSERKKGKLVKFLAAQKTTRKRQRQRQIQRQWQ